MQPRDLQAEKILAEGKNNPNIPNDFPKACLKAMFESSQTYGLFSKYFDTKIYHHAAETHIFNRRHISSVVGVTRVLEDMEISQRNHSPYRDIQRFIEQDFSIVHKDTQIAENFKPYITARITLRLMTEGNLEVLSVSDDNAKVSVPSWLQKNGKCYLIFSYAGNLEIVAKASENVVINLGGMWVPNPEDNSKLIPYWIDYTKLTVNGEVILDKLTPTWFNKPYKYNMDAKAGDEIKIQVEWLPHRSDT